MEKKRYASTELKAKLEARKQKEFQLAKKRLSSKNFKDSEWGMTRVALYNELIKAIEEGTF